MIAENGESTVTGKVLTKGPLVDDPRVTCIVKEGGGDPRLGGDSVSGILLLALQVVAYLKNEPATEVDTPDLLVTVGEAPSLGSDLKDR